MVDTNKPKGGSDIRPFSQGFYGLLSEWARYMY
jgi:hypothetical protein